MSLPHPISAFSSLVFPTLETTKMNRHFRSAEPALPIADVGCFHLFPNAVSLALEKPKMNRRFRKLTAPFSENQCPFQKILLGIQNDERRKC